MRKVFVSFALISTFILLQSCQKTADEYYNSANKLVEEKKLESSIQAISDLDKAISLNSKFAKAYLLRGKTKFFIYFPQKVIKEQGKTELLKNFKIDFTIDEILSDLEDALKYDKHLKINVLIEKGHIYLADKNYELAFKDFEAILEMEPNNRVAANSAIMSKFFMNDTLGGKILLDQLIAQNPNDAQNYYNRAVRRLINLNDKKGACEDLNKALELYDENEKYLYENFNAELNKLLKINCNN